MITSKCDKCGKVEVGKEYLSVRSPIFEQHFDLCGACLIKYDKLWAQAKIELDKKTEDWLNNK